VVIDCAFSRLAVVSVVAGKGYIIVGR